MTNDRTTDKPGLLQLALRAYPRASRADHARELSAIFAEATAGRGRTAALREALDVAGHGLRLRCGLGGQGRGSEIVARAVPLAVTLIATQGAAYVLYMAGLLLTPHQFGRLALGDRLELGDVVGATLTWVAVLALLRSGRWGAARILATIGTWAQVPVVLTALPALFDSRTAAVCESLLPSLFVWLLLLAAPRDVLGPVGAHERRLMGGAALFALLPYALMLLVHYPYVMALYLGFVWFLPAAVALALVRRDTVVPAALGLAAVVGVLRFGLPELAALTSARTVAFAVLALAALTLAWRLDARKRNRDRNPERRAVGS